MFELFADGEEEFFFVGSADQLDVDREAFGRLSQRKRDAGEACEIEPLRETHCVAVVVWIAGPVVAGAVFESRRCGNCGEKDWDFAELPEERSADEIAVLAGFLEGFERDLRLGLRRLKIGREHGAEQRFHATSRFAK